MTVSDDTAELAELIALHLIANPAPVLVNTSTAARMVGMGVDRFRREVAPHIKCVRDGEAGRGKGRAVRLYLVADLQRWAERTATRMSEDLAA
jgi:hypothetical protein